MKRMRVGRGGSGKDDGMRWLVGLLSVVPTLIVIVLALSFLWYAASRISLSLVELFSAFPSLYLPSLTLRSILDLVFMGLLLAYIIRPATVIALSILGYLIGMGSYFVGSFMGGVFLAVRRLGDGTPEFVMPVYGLGVGDLLLSGLFFLMAILQRLAWLAGEWAGMQLPLMLNMAVLMNFLAVLVMWLDKRQAKREGYRVPEKAILRYAVLGGAFGLYVGALAFSHKTKHTSLLAEIGLASMAAFYIMLRGA